MSTLPPLPRLKHELPQLLGVFLLALAVYAFSASHTVGLEDDGMFILAMWNGGVAHPPGYPLYTLLGKVMTSLPLGSVAYRAHLASAVFGAGAAVALWWCIRLLVPGSLPAWTGALAFAFSRTFWSQAVVAEVYSLNALMFFSLLAMALQLHRSADRDDARFKRMLIVMALLAGLSLTNHWPLMVLASPALLLLAWPQWPRMLRLAPLLLIAFMLGLLPYAWMVWRSQQEGAISFYGPIDSFDEFLFVLLRKGYAGIDESGADDAWDKLYFSAFFLRQLILQMGLVGFALAAIGLMVQPRALGLRVTLALLAGFACSSLLLIFLLGFDHSPFYEAVFRVYPLVSYGIMAIWLALGLHALPVWLGRRWKAAAVKPARGLLALAVLAPVLISGWRENDHRDLTYPADYGQAVLESLPPDAVLFAGDDVGFGATAYLHLVEGLRPDVALHEPAGLVLPNRLADPFESDSDELAYAIGHLVTASDRPAYILGQPSPFRGMEHLGLYSRFQSDLDAMARFTVEEPLFRTWEGLLVGGPEHSTWLRVHRDSVSRQFGFVLATNPADSTGELQARLARFPGLSQDNVAGLIGIAQGLLDGPNRNELALLLEVLTRIENELDERTSLEDRARYYGLSGSYFVLSGNLVNAEQFLGRALELWPSMDNPAYAQLAAVFEATGRQADLDRLRRQIPGPR